ncbi:MAG: heme-binding protein [Nitratireductor sp.]
MPSLSLARANKIIRDSFAKAKELNLKPIVVVVYDAGGNLKAYQAQDGASNGRFEIAAGKVRVALATGTGSRWADAQQATRPHFLTGLASVIEGGIVPVAGGVLARDSKGNIIAGVGISGDTADNDEIAALAGIASCGLTPDTGA